MLVPKWQVQRSCQKELQGVQVSFLASREFLSCGVEGSSGLQNSDQFLSIKMVGARPRVFRGAALLLPFRHPIPVPHAPFARLPAEAWRAATAA